MRRTALEILGQRVLLKEAMDDRTRRNAGIIGALGLGTGATVSGRAPFKEWMKARAPDPKFGVGKKLSPSILLRQDALIGKARGKFLRKALKGGAIGAGVGLGGYGLWKFLGRGKEKTSSLLKDASIEYLLKLAYKNYNKPVPGTLSSGVGAAVKSNPMMAASNAVNSVNKNLIKGPRSLKREAKAVGRTLLCKKKL